MKAKHTRNQINRLRPAAIALALLTTVLVSAPGDAKPKPPFTPQLPSTYDAQKHEFVPGEVIVQYKPYVTRGAALNSAYNSNRSVVKALRFKTRGKGAMLVTRVKSGRTVQQEVADLKKNPDVEYAQPNYIYRILSVPNDTDYSKMWGLKNTGQTMSSPVYSTNNPGTSGFDIGIETAWSTITDCSSVTVAVIDSGVNYNHEDLDGNMTSGSYTCPGRNRISRLRLCWHRGRRPHGPERPRHSRCRHHRCGG